MHPARREAYVCCCYDVDIKVDFVIARLRTRLIYVCRVSRLWGHCHVCGPIYNGGCGGFQCGLWREILGFKTDWPQRQIRSKEKVTPVSPQLCLSIPVNSLCLEIEYLSNLNLTFFKMPQNHILKDFSIGMRETWTILQFRAQNLSGWIWARRFATLSYLILILNNNAILNEVISEVTDKICENF